MTVSPDIIASSVGNGGSLHQTLKVLISTLRPQEQEVVNLRYGLLDSQCRTYEAVGNDIGVSEQRVHQALDTAFKKLRHPTRSRMLKKCLKMEC